MSLPSLFFLVWFGVVALTIFMKVRAFRAKGHTFGQAMNDASAKAAAQPRKPAAAMSRSGLKFFKSIGLLMILGAVWTGYSTVTFIQKAAQAQGQLIDFIAHRGSKGGYSYAPRIRFQAATGQIIVFTTRFSTQKYFWPQQRSTVGVYYDPIFPTRARMDCFGDLWFQTLLLLFCGAIFFAISLLAQKNLPENHPLSPPPPGSAGQSGYEIPTIIR